MDSLSFYWCLGNLDNTEETRLLRLENLKMQKTSVSIVFIRESLAQILASYGNTKKCQVIRGVLEFLVGIESNV